jgi:hypothetical protein
MSRRVVRVKIMYTYGCFRWGFTRGIMMGFIRGITLDDHPLRPAKPLLTWAVRGSAGIPDSLVHKPVDTSGRAAGPAFPFARLAHLTIAAYLLRSSSSSFSYYVAHPSFSFCRPALSSRPRGIVTVRTAFYSPTMAAARTREKSLVNGRRFVLRAARRRVIIELSPGNRKRHRIPRPARAMSDARHPEMTGKRPQNAAPAHHRKDHPR